MTFTTYLQTLLNAFVEQYRKHFRPTFGAALILTVISCVIIALLFKNSHFDPRVKTEDLLSYFFYRYSKGTTYSLIDLAKTVFIFFVAIFSLGMLQPGTPTAKHFLQRSGKEWGVLLVTLLLAILLDYILFKTNSAAVKSIHHQPLNIYIQQTIFHLRIYLPMIGFAYAIAWLTGTAKPQLTSRSLLWLYVALWLYNEFAYELALWFSLHILSLVLMPVSDPSQSSLLQSLAGIPLTAFFFIGYYVALTLPLQLAQQPAPAHEAVLS